MCTYFFENPYFYPYGYWKCLILFRLVFACVFKRDAQLMMNCKYPLGFPRPHPVCLFRIAHKLVAPKK